MASEIDWDLLGETNLKVAWRLVSRLLGKDCFPGMLPVPNIEEANYYSLMVSFIRHKGLQKKLSINGPEFQLKGHIVEVARLYKEDGNPDTDMAELLNVCSHLYKAKVELNCKRCQWQQGDMTILVEMSGLVKHVIDWSHMSEGHLVIDKSIEGLEKVNSIYIISEVVYTNHLKMKVNVGGLTLSDEIKKKTPVAFKYTKFIADPLGVLKAKVYFETKLHYNSFFQLVGEHEISLGLGMGGKPEPVSYGTRSGN